MEGKHFTEEDRLDGVAMKIAWLRRRGVSSKDVAQRVGIHPVQLSQLLQGVRSVPGRLELVEMVVAQCVRDVKKKESVEG